MCIHKIITAIVTQISGKNTKRYTRKGPNNVSPWQWPQVRHLYPNFFKLLQIVFFFFLKTNSIYPIPGKWKLSTLLLINKDFLKYRTTTTSKSHLANHHSQARLKRFFISFLIQVPKIQVPVLSFPSLLSIQWTALIIKFLVLSLCMEVLCTIHVKLESTNYFVLFFSVLLVEQSWLILKVFKIL